MNKVPSAIWGYVIIPGLAIVAMIVGVFVVKFIDFGGSEHEHTFVLPEVTVVNTSDPESSSSITPTGSSDQLTNLASASPEKPKLVDVVRAARTWGPAFTQWDGKDAPDFTVTDLRGKEHKLSDYRGKDVMLVFWATWCGPCRYEVPDLIALRNIVSEDKLAILAVSYIQPNNTTAMIERFVKSYNGRINYTVAPVDITTLPAPFDSVQYIPGAFFVDPAGKIKLATSGLIPLHEMQLILQAE